MKIAVSSLIFFMATIPDLRAADICKAVALRDVPAIEDPQSILKRGEYDTAITQYRIDKKTGQTSFCSHGGYCYPTHINENGSKVEALRLTNCRIGARDPYDDPDEITYGVDVIRSSVSAAEFKYEELDNRLLEMGLCSACASNVADHYLRQPDSQCAQLTKRALAGDAKALNELQQDPDYCQYGH
jgi:hypothetical protein